MELFKNQSHSSITTFQLVFCLSLCEQVVHEMNISTVEQETFYPPKCVMSDGLLAKLWTLNSVLEQTQLSLQLRSRLYTLKDKLQAICISKKTKMCKDQGCQKGHWNASFEVLKKLIFWVVRQLQLQTVKKQFVWSYTKWPNMKDDLLSYMK